MIDLYEKHQKLVSTLKTDFRRDLIDKIDWDEKMLAIKGARGVGKSTLMLQHIKETFKTADQALYISMDNILVAGLSIYEIADYHSKHGGTHLFIDEIHKYANWSIELKNIYDDFQNLNVAFTSSSILQIYSGYADLSRRVITHHLYGLSLREYIQIETKQDFSIYPLEEIQENHAEICAEIVSRIKPLPYLKQYLQNGYFPFYLQGRQSYFEKLNNVLNVTLEVDLAYILDINIHNVSKLKRLIKIIAEAVPFQPNISKLAANLDLTRNTLTQYLYYLEQAEIFNLLTLESKSYSNLTKPEKIYLQNPNLCYAVNASSVNLGSLRELFFYNQLNATQEVNFAKEGDFLINGKYVYEVGGQKKAFDQITNVPNSFLAIDEIEFGSKSRIPLWLFGFMY